MTAPDFARVLAAHFGITFGASGWRCSGCGTVIIPIMAADQTSETRECARHAHVAAALDDEVAAAQAEAWDEGYQAGAADAMTSMDARAEFNRPPFSNPYRAAGPLCRDCRPDLAASEGD